MFVTSVVMTYTFDAHCVMSFTVSLASVSFYISVVDVITKVLHLVALFFCCVLTLLLASLWTNFVITKHAKVYFATLLIMLQYFYAFCSPNLLKTKCRPLYLKTQFVPHSKHFSSWL